MLPASSVACPPRIIHQHTHYHHHVHKGRHIHRKRATFYVDQMDKPPRGRQRKRSMRPPPRTTERSPVPEGYKNKWQYFMRHYGWIALAWTSNVIMFVASRVSFGFGFRVAHLPFLGNNRD
jgi:hypothetical protein